MPKPEKVERVAELKARIEGSDALLLTDPALMPEKINGIDGLLEYTNTQTIVVRKH